MPRRRSDARIKLARCVPFLQEGFRATSPEGYRSIDAQINRVNDAFAAQVPNPAAVHQELAMLRLVIQGVVAGAMQAAAAPPPSPYDIPTPMSTAIVPFAYNDRGPAPPPTPPRPAQPTWIVPPPTATSMIAADAV
jgi:hypothetical protein